MGKITANEISIKIAIEKWKVKFYNKKTLQNTVGDMKTALHSGNTPKMKKDLKQNSV